MSLYTYQELNIRKTWLLFAVFCAVVVGVGWAVSFVYNDPSFLVFAAGFSIGSSLFSYWFSDRIALASAGAHQIEKSDHPQLWNIVENLSITAGLPMPRVYVTNDRQINAFATGRNPQHAAIAVTAGALERLSRDELEGVLAHELSHVGNRDILVSTVAVVLAGTIALLGDFFVRSLFFGRGDRDDDRGSSPVLLIAGLVVIILAPLAATLMQLAISRRRESLADASGALLTRYPDGLANALEKIAADTTPLRTASDATAHLWISNPFKGEHLSFVHRLFLTHPPIEERVAALRAMSRVS